VKSGEEGRSEKPVGAASGMVEWVARRATARVEAKAGARGMATRKAAFQDWGGAATQKEEEGTAAGTAVESELGLEAGSLDSEVGHWDSEDVESAGHSDLRSVEEFLGLGVGSLDLVVDCSDSEVGHWDSEDAASAGHSDLRSVADLLGLEVDSLGLAVDCSGSAAVAWEGVAERSASPR
jgi:hypothetical protein